VRLTTRTSFTVFQRVAGKADMSDETIPTPRHFKGVMVSSTFLDLQAHRAELMRALVKAELYAIGMENYVVDHRDDIISSSLNMVRKASAYIGLISHRYGQVVECAERNPHSYSVSRLEFEEAQRLGRPTLIFLMGDGHPVKKAEIDTDPELTKKLEAFRERAKAGRIYIEFNSLEDFKEKAFPAVARLARALEEQDAPPPLAAGHTRRPHDPEANPIPAPPAFYAEPPYIGSHDFVGRAAELERLSDWAAPADPHPVLLFEAIGGTGKSMLTWEWVNHHSTVVRQAWAGRFWYSFYERGAIMADFCRRALAYITRRPLEEFRKKKTVELGEQLLFHLQSSPWLLVLDGLERVLVAYHRFDAAQVADEQVDTSKDQIANRHPCAAIRPEDDDLLRTLAAAAPSKLLITTRLTPRVLLNPSSQSIQGVQRVQLPGLRPIDAEQLLRSCEVTGDSQAIQDYLKRHCDCHPLVTGVLAGLINNYLHDRGNFDAWAADPAAGGRLNLADLDLVQKRNHILLAALAALPEKSRQLLSTLALLSEAVDSPTLLALNPHLPPEPEEVEEPTKPENHWHWNEMSDEEKQRRREGYQAALQHHDEYERAVKARLESPEFLSAPQELAKTVQDLERRSLLQYDHQSKRYDLHPVVRGVAAGRLRQEEKEQYGQRVVDHFSRQAHNPYEEAETLEDVRYGLHVVRTLLMMGRRQQAYDAYVGDLSGALSFNLESNAEILSLLRPFFSHGWATLPDDLEEYSGGYLVNEAALAMRDSGESQEALTVWGALLISVMKRADWRNGFTVLISISLTLQQQNRLPAAERCRRLCLVLAALIQDVERLFIARIGYLSQLATIGRWADAEAMWRLLDPMGRGWVRALYRPGDAERSYAVFRFFQGTLDEGLLTHAEHLARAGKNRYVIRDLHRLRGEWQLEQGRWGGAAESLHEAVRMAREIGHPDVRAEAMLLLAKFHLGQVSAPRDEAEHVAKTKGPPSQALAELWLALGDREQAKKHALAAYEWAWADGEPYVYRYYLNKARALLERLGAEVPDLPPYDPAKDEKLPWEDEVAAAIEKLRAEKEAAESEGEA
jgi:hypothetical protein